MKKITHLTFFIIAGIVIPIVCSLQKENPIPATKISEQQISSGIKYIRYENEAPTIIHVIRFDPNLTKPTLEPAVGQREQVSSIARRTKACVAVNGSNYRRGGRYNGNRLNLMKAHGILYNDPQLPRGAIGWKRSSAEWHIDRVILSWNLVIGKMSCPINRFNQPRKKGEAIVYTPTVDPGVVKGSSCGVDIIIDSKRFVDIVPSGNSSTPPKGFVYQIDTECPTLKKIRVGMPVSLLYEVKPKKEQNLDLWKNDDFLLGGAGFILDEGKILHDELYTELSHGERLFLSADEGVADFHPPDMQKYLIEKEHPRTALGKDDKGFQYIVVVDGRSSLSKGLSLPDLAFFMRTELSCEQALNIGGGGCSTLVIDGKVINNPSQGVERPVSEALCLTGNKDD